MSVYPRFKRVGVWSTEFSHTFFSTRLYLKLRACPTYYFCHILQYLSEVFVSVKKRK